MHKKEDPGGKQKGRERLKIANALAVQKRPRQFTGPQHEYSKASNNFRIPAQDFGGLFLQISRYGLRETQVFLAASITKAAAQNRVAIAASWSRRSFLCHISYDHTVDSVLNRLTDEQLLDLRFCDLQLSIEGTRIGQRFAKLCRELQARRLAFRPHVWLSEEWFTPDGVPGFAIPFYLAHPRLIKLERNQMLQVEGDSEAECMRILRHETGHAIANAHRLHARRSWADTFGSPRVAYPDWYKPQPNSRDYVLNLDAWYAQSHPAEDFAETFAVWLRPG
jgi:hypothetical protein